MTYKHGDWYCKPANEEEAKEIVERAVASGADNFDGLVGKAGDIPYGVFDGIVDFNTTRMWGESTEYTIEQVRQKFPLPGERVAEGWNGECLPPVGWHGEITWGKKSNWLEVVVLPRQKIALSSHSAWAIHSVSSFDKAEFRPLRSERERWVESAAVALHKDAVLTPDQASHAAVAIYDAIKSGDLKLPEVK